MNYSEMLFNRDEKIIKIIEEKNKEIYDLKQEIEYLRSVGSLGILDRKCKELQEEINKQKEVIDKIKEYINRTEINSVGTPLAYTEIGKELLELLEEIE